MSMVGVVLGLALVIALYLVVNRADRNYYKRRQEAIEQRRLRLEERAQERQNNNQDNSGS